MHPPISLLDGEEGVSHSGLSRTVAPPKALRGAIFRRGCSQPSANLQTMALRFYYPFAWWLRFPQVRARGQIEAEAHVEKQVGSHMRD